MPDNIFEAPGMLITRRCVLGNKDDLQVQAGIDQTCGEDDLNELLDRINRVFDRQRAIAELPDKLQALEVARKMPAQMDEEVARLRAEAARTQSGFAARHQASGRGKRGEQWEPSTQERQTLDQYKAQIDNALTSRARFVSDLPIVEWEVERRRAIIAGDPEPPKPAGMVEQILGDVFQRPAAAA